MLQQPLWQCYRFARATVHAQARPVVILHASHFLQSAD